MDSNLPSYMLLDGGMGTEISRRWGDKIYKDPLWSSRLNETDVEVVCEVQRDFLMSGADVIMTNTYMSNVEGVMKAMSISREDAMESYRSAARKTCQVRDVFWENLQDKTGRIRPLVAAAIGPYGTTLPTRTDYCGLYIETTPIDDLVECFRDKTRALLEGGVDILGFETIPAAKEAEAVCRLLKDFPTAKAWIVFCCKDGQHVGHGEKFSDAVMTTLASDAVVGVGVNCSDQNNMTSLLQQIPPEVKRQKKIVIYPNNGMKYNNLEAKWYGNSDEKPIHKYVTEWLDNGANWIGGCCHVTPEHISQMRTEMNNYTNSH